MSKLLDIEKAYNAYQEQSIGSNLEADNINIIASNSALIQGSNLKATNDININAKNTNLLASQDNSNSDTSTKHKNINLGVSVYDGISATISTDKSKATTQSTTYTNTQLNANNININTNQDTTIKGANLKANDTLAINTNNLNIESVQNRQKNRNKSSGFSVGVQSVGFNKAKGSLDSKQTLLTSVEANTVNINTTEQTKLRGATITSVDAQGNDNKQLTLNTNTLIASSLNNRVDSKNKSLGINISRS